MYTARCCYRHCGGHYHIQPTFDRRRRHPRGPRLGSDRPRQCLRSAGAVGPHRRQGQSPGDRGLFLHPRPQALGRVPCPAEPLAATRFQRDAHRRQPAIPARLARRLGVEPRRAPGAGDHGRGASGALDADRRSRCRRPAVPRCLPAERSANRDRCYRGALRWQKAPGIAR